eukprot:2770211-Pleurochrysis_carterae.AAC.1
MICDGKSWRYGRRRPVSSTQSRAHIAGRSRRAARPQRGCAAAGATRGRGPRWQRRRRRACRRKRRSRRPCRRACARTCARRSRPTRRRRGAAAAAAAAATSSDVGVGRERAAVRVVDLSPLGPALHREAERTHARVEQHVGLARIERRRGEGRIQQDWASTGRGGGVGLAAQER